MSAHARHRGAVGQSLTWAEAAADAGDYVEALAWLDTVEAIADEMPPGWSKKRRQWELARDASLQGSTT
jgi:hypothetical protein